MIKIVHAVGDRDGVPGESDRDEITIQNFYDRQGRGWNYLCVCKDKEMGRQACEIGKAIAENSNYGYSQERRTTGAKSVLQYGIGAGRGDFDCSSFVSFCYYYVKVLPKYNYNTDSLLTALKGTQLFDIIKNPGKCEQARIGSLLLSPKKLNDGKGHVAMSITDGSDTEPEDDPVVSNSYILFNGAVNVRSTPSLDGKRLGVAHLGNKLEYLGDDKDTGWHEVIYNGRQGFVTGNPKYQRYMEIVNV